jgi:hypothetical protein
LGPWLEEDPSAATLSSHWSVILCILFMLALSSNSFNNPLLIYSHGCWNPKKLLIISINNKSTAPLSVKSCETEPYKQKKWKGSFSLFEESNEYLTIELYKFNTLRQEKITTLKFSQLKANRLHKLASKHQLYWKKKEKRNEIKVVNRT